MINNFTFTKKDIIIPVSLGYRRIIFDNVPRELATKFVNSSEPLSISWEVNNIKFNILECKYAYPTVDQNSIICITIQKQKSFPKNTLTIYNQEGEIQKILQPPNLLSSIWQHRLSTYTAPANELFDNLFFENVRWDNDSGGKLVTVVRIRFDQEWHEDRVLDPESGLFGECIASGRI